MIRTTSLQKSFAKNHLKKRRLLQDKNQGVYVEDILLTKQRFREGAKTSLLPRIMPHTSTSMGAKNSLRMEHLPQRSLDAKRQSDYNQLLNGQVYGNLYQVSGSAGNPDRGIKSQLEKQYNHQTYSPQKEDVKQPQLSTSDGSPGNFQD